MFRAALVVLSDRAASGTRPDGCIAVMKDKLGPGYAIVRETILPDDAGALAAELIEVADSASADLILTSGGTGLGPRDRTPQATAGVLDYEVPGLCEAIRVTCGASVRTAMLSRAIAGVRHRCLIVNLPGSPSAVGESLDVIAPALPHALELLAGDVVDG